MASDSDLLFVVLAARMGFAAPVSAERAEELEASLAPAPRAAIVAAVAAHIAQAGGDTARALDLLRGNTAVGRAASGVRKAAVTQEPRYRLGAEIGRGGLGRVLEARDMELDRDVAVKLVLDGLPPVLKERFLQEARLTARLEHPNIVPVHGLVTGEGGPPMLAMKRVRGRDLASLVRDLAGGEPAATAAWSRPRLLAMFQDICLGVAFAHDRGVIHRDLKPSNVMIGDYGETLIVDWGLAKERQPGAESGEWRERPGDRTVQADAQTQRPSSAVTLQGEVVGTPAYMAPEQAAGRQAEVDERSDIYALGAILYELLTFLPPVEGASVDEVLSQAKSGVSLPPSQRLWKRDPKAPSIPPELDALVMKALALRREDRFQSAMEIHREIQLFLEGVRERERNHRLAEEAVAQARKATIREELLKAESKGVSEEAKKKEQAVKPLDDKAALWALQDRAKRLGRAAVDAFSEADALLSSALTHEPLHPEARRLRAEQYWKRYLAAEEAGDDRELRYNRAVVERYNDGAFDALLKGDGTLTVRTRAYPCGCLADGRTVQPGELAWQGYRVFSGRAIDGHKGGEGLPELEPMAPASLRVHAAGCEPAELEGADVWLFRHDETGRRLVPATPADVQGDEIRPVPVAVLNATFGKSSPFRPEGPGAWLGRTPIEKRPLPMGSYLLLVALEGRAPLRIPVSIPRCGHWEQQATLFRPEEIPAGFIPVAAGTFGYQGDPGNPYTAPAETRDLDDVFVARHPVTCREYCEFLNDLAKTNPGAAAGRVPRESQESGPYWPGPPWVVPTAAWLATAPAELKANARRLQGSPVDWEESWPVLGVSWEDGMAYAAWKRSKQGFPVTLTHEVEWEKAARGPDRRCFPWGNHWDDRWANGYRSNPAGAWPAGVEEFASDESPYGVRGLGGNSRDVCLNSAGAEYPSWRLARGGYWANSGVDGRATFRAGFSTRIVACTNGFRLSCPVRLAKILDSTSPPA